MGVGGRGEIPGGARRRTAIEIRAFSGGIRRPGDTQFGAYLANHCRDPWPLFRGSGKTICGESEKGVSFRSLKGREWYYDLILFETCFKINYIWDGGKP